MPKNLIFDMDDTLSECSPFYKACREKFVEFSHQRTDVDSQIIRSILSSIDVACTNMIDGFGKERFPRSFAATSAALDIVLGNEVDDAAAEQSYLIGHSVFDAEYPLYAGVTEMLLAYKAAGFRLFLCTKGDYGVQHRKIVKNGLDQLFDNDCIYIVPKKTGAQLAKIIEDHNLSKRDTYMIGDSVRDDIGSALSVGIESVLVEPYTGGGTWEYENESYAANHTIERITDLPTVILYA